jgi:hypothetical protein
MILLARFLPPPQLLPSITARPNPNFRLACQLGGATDDRVIIQQLPLFLSDTARAWLEDLPPQQIHDWNDLDPPPEAEAP